MKYNKFLFSFMDNMYAPMSIMTGVAGLAVNHRDTQAIALSVTFIGIGILLAYYNSKKPKYAIQEKVSQWAPQLKKDSSPAEIYKVLAQLMTANKLAVQSEYSYSKFLKEFSPVLETISKKEPVILKNNSNLDKVGDKLEYIYDNLADIHAMQLELASAMRYLDLQKNTVLYRIMFDDTLYGGNPLEQLEKYEQSIEEVIDIELLKSSFEPKSLTELTKDFIQTEQRPNVALFVLKAGIEKLGLIGNDDLMGTLKILKSTDHPITFFKLISHKDLDYSVIEREMMSRLSIEEMKNLKEMFKGSITTLTQKELLHLNPAIDYISKHSDDAHFKMIYKKQLDVVLAELSKGITSSIDSFSTLILNHKEGLESAANKEAQINQRHLKRYI